MVVTELMSLFAEVEVFWQLGEVGPHMQLTPVPDAFRVTDVE
jgi:hypothetical protein